jgi:hypothetical protein
MEPSIPSLRILKKHVLLFPEIIPGQIEITPIENPKTKIVII